MLHSLGLLDTESEEAFDRIKQAVSQTMKVHLLGIHLPLLVQSVYNLPFRCPDVPEAI